MKGQSKRIISLFALVSAASLGWGAQAVKPDFSGKWMLDKSSSRSARSDNWVSAELDIEQSAERVICQTTTNTEKMVATSVLGEPTDGIWRANGQPVKVGPNGLPVPGKRVMMKVEWADGKLIVRYMWVKEEGMETWSLSPDGRTLTIEVLRKDGDGNEETSTEVYRKQ